MFFLKQNEFKTNYDDSFKATYFSGKKWENTVYVHSSFFHQTEESPHKLRKHHAYVLLFVKVKQKKNNFKTNQTNGQMI